MQWYLTELQRNTPIRASGISAMHAQEIELQIKMHIN